MSVGLMKPLWYPKAQLSKNPGPIHMNLLFNKSLTFLSYSTISTYRCAQPRCLIESTPTIILKLGCSIPHPPETSLIYLFKQNFQKWLFVWIKYFIKNQNILCQPSNWARLILILYFFSPPSSQMWFCSHLRERVTIHLELLPLISCH